MTTSFAHFVAGRFWRAFGCSNGHGAALMHHDGVLGWDLYRFHGRPAHRLLNLIPAKYYLWPLLVFGVPGVGVENLDSCDRARWWG